MNTLIEIVSNGAEFIMMNSWGFGPFIMIILVFIVWAVLFVASMKIFDLIVLSIHKSKIYIRDYIEHRKDVRRMIKIFGAPYKINTLKTNGKWIEKKYYF